jgi:hypothetical protein
LERIPSFDGAASDPEEDSSCNPQNPDSLPEDQFLVFDPDAVRQPFLLMFYTFANTN